MKRLITCCLLLTFQIGYLEWGKGNHVFIFQAEADIISKAGSNPAVVLHPFILIPLLGQLMILFTIFQQNSNRTVTLAGLICLSVLMLFLFFIGIISLNIKILASTIPFIITGILLLRHNRKPTVAA